MRLTTTNIQYGLDYIDKLIPKFNADHPALYPELIGEEMQHNKVYLRLAAQSDITGPFVTDEGDTYNAAEHVSPFSADIYAKKYAFQYTVSREAIYTDQTAKMGGNALISNVVKNPTRLMDEKMKYQEDQSAADLFNLGFSTFASGGVKCIETVAAFSTTHATSAGAVGSNLMNSALSVSALQTAIQNVLSQTTYMGVPWQYSGTFKLVVPPALMMLALELCKSSERPDTADRAKNVLQQYVTPVVVPHLTSTADWWIIPAEKSKNPATRVKWLPLETNMKHYEETGGSLGIFMHKAWIDIWTGYEGTMGSDN